MPWLVRFLLMQVGTRAVRWGWQRYKARPSAQRQAMQAQDVLRRGYGNGGPYQVPYQWQYNPPSSQGHNQPRGYDSGYGPPR